MIIYEGKNIKYNYRLTMIFRFTVANANIRQMIHTFRVIMIYECGLSVYDIILYKKFVEHHVNKLILLKFSIFFIKDIFNKINLFTWCSTNFLYKIV